MAKSKHKRTPKTVLKLPDLEQSKSAVMEQPDVGEFKALLRSCDSRIHRLVLLRASTRLQQDGGHTIPDCPRTAVRVVEICSPSSQ